MGVAKKDRNSKGWHFDPEVFAKDLKAARDSTKPSDKEEQAHLAKLELWTTCLGVLGLLFAIRGVISPLAMLMLAAYRYAKFAILAHHSLHGGWGTGRRGWYAMGGYRRFIDWLDWIFPMAWIVEHNKWHHYRLNEDADPDFVERNLAFLRTPDMSKAAKYFTVLANVLSWKWFYYSSNTLKLLHADKPGAPEKLDERMIHLVTVVRESYQGDSWYRSLMTDLVFRALGPPALLQFLAVPIFAGLLQWFIGGNWPWLGALVPLPFCWAAVINVIGAEMVTNMHAFATIVTNHAGSDLYAFDSACGADTPEFFLRAILGSVAYHAGTDLIDYFHGFLNYQGEHHAFPALSPLHYQRLHPVFKKVCSKHRVPYVQEPVWVRVKKTIDIMVGEATHPRISGQAVEQPEIWSVHK